MKKLTKIQNAIDLLKKGEIIILPTDTIYGISCLYSNKPAINNIYKIKKRNTTKPFVLLISHIKQLELFNINPKKYEQEYIKKWPEKTTVVFDCFNDDLRYLHKDKNTLAIKLTKNKICKPIIDEVCLGKRF